MDSDKPVAWPPLPPDLNPSDFFLLTFQEVDSAFTHARRHRWYQHLVGTHAQATLTGKY
jgi:hypothetical protein